MTSKRVRRYYRDATVVLEDLDSFIEKYKSLAFSDKGQFFLKILSKAHLKYWVTE